VKVLVVTEIRLYREGVADALRLLPDIEVALTADNAAAAVVTARQAEVDVVLLDMTLSDTTRATRSLLAARPRLKVVALGAPDEGPEVVACAEAGITGYVPRDATLDDLAEALRCTMRGEASCSARVAADLLQHIARQARLRGQVAMPVQLTPRERDVLRLLESGLTNRQIARTLDLQVSTVKNHVHNILTKSGAAGRSDLARVTVGS
jgi:two-component system nitrate/nitrite response regulator NarL